MGGHLEEVLGRVRASPLSPGHADRARETHWPGTSVSHWCERRAPAARIAVGRGASPGEGNMATVTPAPATRREPVLAGQTVVLIGGSAGIGFETARQARAEGAEVILVGRNPDRLAAAAETVGAAGTAAFDATEPEHLERFFADLPGPIDHVLVTAGG